MVTHVGGHDGSFPCGHSVSSPGGQSDQLGSSTGAAHDPSASSGCAYAPTPGATSTATAAAATANVLPRRKMDSPPDGCGQSPIIWKRYRRTG